VEGFRRFASTYLACDRTFPHIARSAKRLWHLSGASLSEGNPDCERDELNVRRLLQFARDTFSLQWVADEEPVEEDPCSLHCLHAARETVLTVSYCGPNRTHMRPSDVARGEMKMRQRFLEYLHQGGLLDDPLPACDLPQEASEAISATGPCNDTAINSDTEDLMKQRSQEMEAPEETKRRLEAFMHLGGFLPAEETAHFDSHGLRVLECMRVS